MASTPKRLSGPAQLSNTSATVYTVPAATKTILRHIQVFNPDTVQHTLFLSIGADAAGVRIYDGFVIAAGQPLDVWGYYVLETTEIIAAHADAAAHLVMTLNGDEKTLG